MKQAGGTMNELLTITDLSKRYDGFALRDVSLSVPAGSVVGLVGANGAGKTTVIKAALGLIRPDGGKVRLFGTASAWCSTLARCPKR